MSESKSKTASPEKQEPLKSFRDGLRVRVIDADDPDFGKTGTVVRLRMQDQGAWVNLDTRPAHVHFQPPDDRCNHSLLFPHQCEIEGREGR